MPAGAAGLSERVTAALVHKEPRKEYRWVLASNNLTLPFTQSGTSHLVTSQPKKKRKQADQNIN